MNIQDEEHWLANFIQVPLDEEIRDRVKNFALLWNLFETFVCNKMANENTISAGVDLIDSFSPITTKLTDQYLNYFNNRYIDVNGQSNNRFASLLFRNNATINFVLDILTRQKTNPNDVLKACLYIILRFRNNLFHGEKNVAQLNGQSENFAIANSLLIDILDIMRNHGRVNQYNFPLAAKKKVAWYQWIINLFK